MSLGVRVKFKENDIFETDFYYSQVKVVMDRKKENYTPLGPNPTELFLASLGGCIGVYAKRYLERHSISFDELTVEVSGEFSSDTPKRLVNIKAIVTTDADLSGREDIFYRFISNCPVHNTVIHTDNIEITVSCKEKD